MSKKTIRDIVENGVPAICRPGRLSLRPEDLKERKRRIAAMARKAKKKESIFS